MTRNTLHEIFGKKHLTNKNYKDRIIPVSNIPISYIPHKNLITSMRKSKHRLRALHYKMNTLQ